MATKRSKIKPKPPATNQETGFTIIDAIAFANSIADCLAVCIALCKASCIDLLAVLTAFVFFKATVVCLVNLTPFFNVFAVDRPTL